MRDGKKYRVNIRKSTLEIIFYFNNRPARPARETWMPIYKALRQADINFQITFPTNKSRGHMILKFSDLENLTLAKLLI